jgi:hypothetical protein
VKIFDGQTLSLAFFKNITIFLNNINDNSPIFEVTSYDFNVSENIIPPILIGQVRKEYQE